MNSDWESRLATLWHQALHRFRKGRNSPNTLFDPDEIRFLHEIGCSPQELFDFVEDHEGWGEPDFDVVLDVQRIRHRYLHEVLDGRPPGPPPPAHSLPAKTDAINGIAWLPRLIVKARLKLRGELPPELMYGCGGDRPFLRRAGFSLAEFLQLTWDSGSDDTALVAAFRQRASRPS